MSAQGGLKVNKHYGGGRTRVCARSAAFEAWWCWNTAVDAKRSKDTQRNRNSPGSYPPRCQLRLAGVQLPCLLGFRFSNNSKSCCRGVVKTYIPSARSGGLIKPQVILPHCKVLYLAPEIWSQYLSSLSGFVSPSWFLYRLAIAIDKLGLWDLLCCNLGRASQYIGSAPRAHGFHCGRCCCSIPIIYPSCSSSLAVGY
ncbi:uncharacterized protein HMPREF1120_03391 [Exophiala dermatitidis NIH/UT8656]|uniref:Uncharacterized protein n=1 Tax=Exophiala dermatitidis (strain ATCC 34100 / CBS 525.76 / NIH/UT8656) TaxID=858893 RepID=H6BWK0_EXODN|nr:uncharacterized protein HMPREF1120_03391 [Exophiala dermatitidis NIH/UT8656]EHY55246.1 hypothetical protein HMPREF1120_03391 [Exophiala dermatitidis NIH/UT8656]